MTGSTGTSAAPCIADLAPADPLIEHLAAALRGLDVMRGDRVAWQLPNSPVGAALMWACWKLGAVAVPIHHRAAEAERARLLGPLDVAVELDPDQIDHLVRARILAAPIADAPPARSIRPTTLALILHTSGSSGTPKGVLHTQGSLANKASRMVDIHGLGSTDVALMPAPMGHISGVQNGVTLPAAAGMRTVWMSRWDPDHAIDLIEAEHVTFMVGPPTFFHDLLEACGQHTNRLSSLRLISAGGAGVTEDFCRELAAITGARVKRSYGSTEAPTVTTTATGTTATGTAAGVGPDPDLWGFSTDGRPFSPTELRLAADGEIQIRGPELFAGYTVTGVTAAAFTADRWFRTGDLGRIDDHGCLTVTGRLGDLIIRGGENISAANIEAAIRPHPDISDLAVIGVDDRRLGERIGVVIVLRAGAATLDLAALRAWCEQFGLARYSHPEVMTHATALPRLSSGKVDRRQLQDQLQQELQHQFRSATT